MVQSKLLMRFKGLKAYFFDRHDSFQLNKFCIDKKKIINCEQLHGSKVAVADTCGKRNYFGYDGLLSREKVYLNIRTADCLPIFFYDDKIKVIGAIHAGWKGLLSGIIDNTIMSLKKIGCRTEDILTSIGPHIQVCCYRVSKTRWNRFKNYYESSQTAETHNRSSWYLDLEKIAVISLLKQGVLKDNIEMLPHCTYCDKRFFSRRRDGPDTGRMLNIIGFVT